jgi:tRNA (cmo5U34)-methyltransferase
MTIGDAFNATVDYYDDWMRIALPGYADLFGTATDLVPAVPEKAIDVLDLGAGTGLFSWHVRGRFPHSRLVLVDVADRLLDVARVRFAGDDSVEYLKADYRTIELEPARQFDAVVSSLSIHHLEDEEKAALFRRVFDLVRPGGVFLNVDQIRGETAAVRDLYWTSWLARVRRAGAPEARIAESIERRQTYDRDALLADQLRWLHEAGFEDVDCVYKNYFVGVFYGRKGSR